jgi:hypothetical protein
MVPTEITPFVPLTLRGIILKEGTYGETKLSQKLNGSREYVRD